MDDDPNKNPNKPVGDKTDATQGTANQSANNSSSAASSANVTQNQTQRDTATDKSQLTTGQSTDKSGMNQQGSAGQASQQQQPNTNNSIGVPQNTPAPVSAAGTSHVAGMNQQGSNPSRVSTIPTSAGQASQQQPNTNNSIRVPQNTPAPVSAAGTSHVAGMNQQGSNPSTVSTIPTSAGQASQQQPNTNNSIRVPQNTTAPVSAAGTSHVARMNQQGSNPSTVSTISTSAGQASQQQPNTNNSIRVPQNTPAPVSAAGTSHVAGMNQQGSNPSRVSTIPTSAGQASQQQPNTNNSIRVPQNTPAPVSAAGTSHVAGMNQQGSNPSTVSTIPTSAGQARQQQPNTNNSIGVPQNIAAPVSAAGTSHVAGTATKQKSTTNVKSASSNADKKQTSAPKRTAPTRRRGFEFYDTMVQAKAWYGDLDHSDGMRLRKRTIPPDDSSQQKKAKRARKTNPPTVEDAKNGDGSGSPPDTKNGDGATRQI